MEIVILKEAKYKSMIVKSDDFYAVNINPSDDTIAVFQLANKSMKKWTKEKKGATYNG